MIQCGEHQVNRGGLGLARLLEMGFEIADSVIARVRIAERVAIVDFYPDADFVLLECLGGV